MKNLASLALVLMVVASCDKNDVRPQSPSGGSVNVDVSAATSAPSASTTSAPPRGSVRAERSVVVDGVTETWLLEWTSKVENDCIVPDWCTCPCAGFAFGETGKLDLVRQRPAAPEERLHLGDLFEGGLGADAALAGACRRPEALRREGRERGPEDERARLANARRP